MAKLIRLEEGAWRARCAAAGIASGASGWRLAVPVWFDTAIGYWTGEPDWALLVAALERALRQWEVTEVIVPPGWSAVDAAPGSWLPRCGAPGPSVLLSGREGAWLLALEATGDARVVTGGRGAQMLVAWAEREGLELVREDGAAWRW